MNLGFALTASLILAKSVMTGICRITTAAPAIVKWKIMQFRNGIIPLDVQGK
jgi:hypothetical protein